MIRQSKFLTLALCLIVAVALLTSCAKSTTTASLTAAQIISKANDKMDAAHSFHFILDQTGGGTPVGTGMEMTKVEGDMVRPDSLKATVTAKVSGISISVQMISVGKVSYMTNPLSGNWEQPPAQFAALSVFDPNTGATTVMKGITNLTKLSDEQSGGVTCDHLSGNIDSEKLNLITGSSVKGTAISVELWIGRDDFLVRSIKFTGKITETEVPGIVRTLNFSSFGEAITIELPK